MSRSLKPATHNAPKLLMLLLSIALGIALAPQAHAVVDLLNPTAGNVTNDGNVRFEYYVSMHNLTGCTLTVNGVAFNDANAKSNTISGVQVQNITAGVYLWNVTCTNGPLAETSSTRNLTIDAVLPTLIIVTPNNGTAKSIALDIIAADDQAALLQCSAAWNDQTLEQFAVSSNAHYAKTYAGISGNGTLNVTCSDTAGNAMWQTRTLNIIPDFSLMLALDKEEYGLGENARLTISAISGANVSIDICPDQQGFVQCNTALLAGNIFPQTITLPYMNKTGAYLIEGMASFGGQTKINQTKYRVTNTIVTTLSPSEPPRLNRSFMLHAIIGGGIAPYRTTWRLSNGTILHDHTAVNFTYRLAGNYTEQITVFDHQNNTKATNVTFTIAPSYLVTIYVKDNVTGALMDHVEVSIDDRKDETIQGIARFNLDEGAYRVFASAPGYQYRLEEISVDSAQSYTLLMARSTENVPGVTVSSPVTGSTAYSPVPVRFSVNHDRPVSCTLFQSSDGNWFTAAGSMNVSGNATQEFKSELQPGTYQLRVDCTDRASRTGSSSKISFTVAAPQGVQTAATATAPSAGEIGLQATLDSLDAILSSIDGYGPKEKEIIAITGFDKNLRTTKRAVQQAIRDINDLQYRKELDDAARAAEQRRIIEGVNEKVRATPVGLTVSDTKSFVRYVKEDDLDKVASMLSGINGIAADKNALQKNLLPDQQKFTVSTKIAQVEQIYPDNSTKTVMVVTRNMKYATGLGSEYQVYELIPKEVISSARDLVLITKADVAKDDPVLRFAQEETITYIIPKRVDFTRMEEVKTVLVKPYAAEKSMITGLAIFEGGEIGGVSIWLVLLIGLIIASYLAYYFNITKQLRFIWYKVSRNEKEHYVRVLINDATDNLDSNNYEKADLLYKEIRLSYDTLPVPSRNALYEDIVTLVQRMDSYYFNMVMIELDQNLKANKMDAAIESYEKLTGTFARLDMERQQQLVSAVTAMARRLGLEARS